MWHVKKLRGLPATGPFPEQFSASGMGMHREGVVFEFTSDTGQWWVGNFQPGLFGETDASPSIQLDERFVLVFAEGQGYLVNPDNRSVERYIGGAVMSVMRIENPYALVLSHQDLQFEAIDANGTLWQTKRLSWDGFRNVKYLADSITGEGWNAYEDTWEGFTVSLKNGRTNGGAYHL